MNKKMYTQAPLPFMGQKRRFIGEFKKVLKNYPDDVTIVDLFGGSGLLSHVAKREKPLATVVYNDFDGYHRRIEAIPHTNKLLERIREITDNLPRDKRIEGDARTRILALIAEEDNKGFVDYITLSASLLFSMKYATSYQEMSQETFYNRINRAGYHAEGYLDGITVTCQDYRCLFEEYKQRDNVLFLVDPPYLATESKPYTMSWRLGDYLDVLTVLQGHNYIYFTSEKSQIIELCEWIGRSKLQGNPFERATRVDVDTRMNFNSRYTDIMLYRKAVQ